MNYASPKQFISFVLACVLSVFLIIFGFKLFSLSDGSFTPTQFFIFGVILTLGGVAVTSSQSMKERWIVGFALMAAGFYLFGRAANAITMPWLAYLAGTFCFVAAAILIYIAWPKPKTK